MDLTPHPNLLSDPGLTSVPPTLLPDDPAADELEQGALAGAGLPDVDTLAALAADFPASSLVWAQLAELALDRPGPESAAAAYAYARTGYHRGLDALRRAGWRGSGPVPYDHDPNQGFLRALAALARAADQFGESDEAQRCADFLYESSPDAYAELLDDHAGRTDGNGRG